MIPMTAAQKERYMNVTTLKANGQVIAEWNLNRSSGGPSVRNPQIDPQPEDQYFTIESVAEPDRPPRGIVRGITEQVPIFGTGVTSSPATDLVNGSTAYVSSLEDQYRYWLSPTMGPGLSNAAIELTYATPIPFNKIVIGFETAHNIPNSVLVEWKAGPTWTGVNISSPVIDEDGRLILYRQEDGTFSQTPNIAKAATAIEGIRMSVPSVWRQGYLAVIELSPRLVVDITDYIVDVTVNMEMADDSKIAPLGVASSNTASIVLDNTDRYFSNENPESPFYGIFGKGISISSYVSPTRVGQEPTPEDRVTLFENMSVVSIDDDKEQSVALELKDSSRILQERKPNRFLLENVTIAEAVIRVCHSVGFNDIDYNLSDVDPRDTGALIPYFWTNDEDTAWENISKLAEATQTAVYFDEYDKLKVKTRRAAFDLSKPTSWVFDAKDVTQEIVDAAYRPVTDIGKKSDLEKFEFQEDDVPNHVDVNYYKTEPSRVNRGIPEMVVAWEPEGDVVLRSAKIIADIPSNGDTVRLNASESQTWPYAGMLQVNGEVIEYDGKQYSYHDSAGVRRAEWIYSHEEKADRDSQSPNTVGLTDWTNSFTGLLKVKKRGVYFTQPAHHMVSSTSGYLVRRKTSGGPIQNVPNNLTGTRSGIATLASGASGPVQNATTVVAKRLSDHRPRMVGTRVRFPENGPSYGCAGVVIGCGSLDSGIYIELAKTTATKDRTSFNEINVYWKATNGAATRYGPNGGKGVPYNVAPGVWYDIDVDYYTDTSHHRILVYINGTTHVKIDIPRSGTIATLPTEQGFFYRGPGSAEFEHFYHMPSIRETEDNLDGASFYDIRKGGYRSMIFHDALWNSIGTLDPWTAPGYIEYNKRNFSSRIFLDEFGLLAHEVREFSVTYDEGPMLHSNIYLSNEAQVGCTDFRYGPFGADFTLVNKARHNAVAHGEDTITFGADNSVSQKLMVYGRQLKPEDGVPVTSINRRSLIRNGRIDLDVANEWIQTKTHAQALADWIAQDHGGGEFTASAEVFANPHIQLGDIVAFEHPDRDVNSIYDRYFVVGKSIKYDGTLQMDLTLRSVL